MSCTRQFLWDDSSDSPWIGSVYIIFYTLIIATTTLVQVLTWAVGWLFLCCFSFLQFKWTISSSEMLYQIPLLVSSFETLANANLFNIYVILLF